jgi:hypothetical protein
MGRIGSRWFDATTYFLKHLAIKSDLLQPDPLLVDYLVRSVVTLVVSKAPKREESWIRE